MQEITETIEEKFDKKKDFLEVNSPICSIDESKSLSLISELFNKNHAENSNNKIKTSLDYNLLMTFYNCIRKSNEHLISFYKMVTQFDFNTRKLFFVKNEIFENFIINNSNIDYLNYYAGAVGCISNQLTEKIILSENINIIRSYVLIISSMFSKSVDEETINCFKNFILKNKDNLEVMFIISQLSVMSGKRDNDCEEILMDSKNYDAILKYGENFRLYRNEVVNACLKICDKQRSADNLNHYIKNILDRVVDFKNDKQIEDFFINNYSYSSHNITLYNYLALLSKTTRNNPFVECVAAVAKTGNMGNLEKILRFYKDYYGNVKVPRLEEEVEKFYLKSCSGEMFFNYIKSNSIVNDSIIEHIANTFYNYPEQIYKYVFDNNLDDEKLNNILINSHLTLKYAITRNIRLADRENFIFNANALNIGFTTTAERANAIVKYIEIVYDSEKSVECLEQYEKNMMLFLDRNPELFIKIILKYVSYTGKRFARYETFLSKMINNTYFGFEKSINEYMAYCDNAKTKGVKKINDILFSVNITSKEHKDLLLKYVLDYAKAPCELFDKSKIGDDPRYLQFKEDYEREKLARVKRQRRKPSGINPQEQGESGQGQQAPVGEDTNV